MRFLRNFYAWVVNLLSPEVIRDDNVIELHPKGTSTFDPNFDGTPGIDSVTPRIRLHSIGSIGVLDFSNSDDVFVIRPDSTEKIRIRGDGKTSFHNDVAVDTSDEPTISLAIGHADTGFDSISDLSHKLSLANFETIFANDANKNINDKYKLNFPEVYFSNSKSLNLILKI